MKKMSKADYAKLDDDDKKKYDDEMAEKGCKGDDMYKSESDTDGEETEQETIPMEALNKSIQDLVNLAKSEGTVDDRQKTLAAKMATDGLSKSEKLEFAELLAADEEMSKSFVDIIREDELIKSEIDGTDFLDAYVIQVGTHLDNLGERMEKSEQRAWQYNRALAQALVSQKEVIEGLSKSLAEVHEIMTAVGSQSQGRKSVVRKSEIASKPFVGTPEEQGTDAPLTKSEVLGKFSKLAKSHTDVEGEDVLVALTDFNSTGNLTPTMAAALRAVQ